MYQTLTADRLRRHFGFSDEYRVDAVLASGTWDLLAETHHVPHLVAALTDLGLGDIAAGRGPGGLRRIEIPQFGHAREFTVDGRRFWFVPVMGTAVMAQYLHAASLMGATSIVLVGTVGGLSPRLCAADFIVPTVARGTHSAWMFHRVDPPDFPADPTLSASLLRRLRAADLGGSLIAEGPTTTCESISAETWEDVQEWSRQGYLGVEMEAALTFAVGAHFATSAAAVLYVADNLIAEVGFFDAGHADSAAVRARARQLQYDVALAELLQPAGG